MADENEKKKSRKPKDEKKKKDKPLKKNDAAAAPKSATAPAQTLLADEKSVDSKLSSLFAVQAPVKRPILELPILSNDDDDDDSEASIDDELGEKTVSETQAPQDQSSSGTMRQDSTRKRKHRDAEDDLEDAYMRKLEREAEQEEQPRLKRKREEQVNKLNGGASATIEENASSAEEGMNIDEDDDEAYSPPKHESETALSLDLDKAGRTVFIGNVSTKAITEKSARKALEKHLSSFFDQVKAQDGEASPKLESIRFRSTPYTPSLPKKAAYARGEIMSTTAQSTNAYAIYSTPALAREACRRLNGTVVLDRHIRVDSVAHPAPVAHRRCVFVGNLGFVDDESNIIAANEAEGREKRKQSQKPSDVEEGLWRLFAKHGSVESVRVIRDKGTRVGIGIAYVQFTDENAIESALSEDGKKAPPMLPRKLRVARAKALSKTKGKQAAVADERPKGGKAEKAEGFKRKITPGESTMRGRVGKLMGTAAAAMTTKPGFKAPESFVFEGHRASSKQKNTGLRLGRKVKSKGKPTNRSARRGAAYKAGGGKKASQSK